MQGMSLLIVSAEIQIQKPHLRWPPQNPSLYNSFFFLKNDVYGSVWLPRKSGKKKENYGFSVLCCVCSLSLIFIFIFYFLWVFAFGLEEWMLF